MNNTELHSACREGNVSIVRKLILEHKADVNARNNENNTPLHLAARFGKEEVALTLINEFGCDIKVKGQFGRSLLHSACEGGNVNLVRKLILEHKAEVNARDDQNNTPLHLAAGFGKEEVTLALINEFGCDTKVKGQLGRSLLHSACQEGNVSLVRKLILEHKADVNARDDQNNTPLHLAAWFGKEEVTLALINEIGCDTKVKGQLGRSLLHSACQGGNVNLVRKLILEHKADVNARDDQNNTPLHLAAGFGKEEVTLALINEIGCDTKVKGQLCRSLLHNACQEGNVSLVRKLILEHKADVNARDDQNNTPLHLAACFGKEEVTLALINEIGCDTKVKGQLGRSLLHSACEGGNVNLVRKLILEHKADVNARDDQNNTPLHLAACFGKEEVTLALINEIGCDTKVKGQLCRSLLHNACQEGNVSLVRKLILEHKADVNTRDDQNNTPLHLAACFGKEEVALTLINEFGCDTKVKSQFGRSLLHNACQGGNVNLVRKLILEHKADVNARDDQNNTPLHLAAWFGKEEVTLALINEIGCDTKVKGQLCRSLLHSACQGGNVNLVRKLILEHKADVNTRDDQNNTPLHLAAGFGKEEVTLALINEFGCDTKVKGQVGRSFLHSACEGGNVSLVQKLMFNYEHLSPLVVDEDGNTPLHICAYLGHIKCVEALLLSKAPVLIRNSNAKAPIDLTKGEVKVFLDKCIKETQLVDYELLREHAKNKYSGSEHITRIFVIGNPGAGKSSLIESLKREGYFQYYFVRVSKSMVPPHTAGIIPSIHVSKQYGRALFYDFAGDSEYYSSHAAILEKLASSQIGDNIFLLVADLREEDSVLQNQLHYWFSFIQYQNINVRLPSLIVIGSHADLLSKNVASEKWSLMEDFVSTVSQSKVIDDVSHYMLDCCRPGSKQIGNIQNKIKSLIQDSPRYNLLLEESILLGILDRDFSNVIACPVSTIASHLHLTGIPLAKTPKGLYPIFEHLQSIGTLFVVGEKRGNYHVVLNTSKLTNTVHEMLFSKHAILGFCKKLKLDTTFLNIGVIPESFLQKLPPYITKECLIQFQYCQEIKKNSISFFPSIPQCNSSLLFFPALCRLDKSEESWFITPSLDTYSIGWLAQCADPFDFFPPRFLHVLLLRVVFRFTLSAHCVKENESISGVSSDHIHLKRRCTMWKTGVHWLMKEGVECRVELVESNKSVVVATRSFKADTENCVTVFNDIVNCVMEAKTEFCHTTRPEFFLLDSNSEADYLVKDNHFAISDAESVLWSLGENFVVSITGRKAMERSKLLCMRKLTYWNSLFPIDITSVLHYLKDVVKELYHLGLHLKIAEGKLDAIGKDYPTDTEKRRRELVKEWMNSSLEPPCWWQLVEALNKASHGVLAEEIEQEHSEFIGIRVSLYNRV